MDKDDVSRVLYVVAEGVSGGTGSDDAKISELKEVKGRQESWIQLFQ